MTILRWRIETGSVSSSRTDETAGEEGQHRDPVGHDHEVADRTGRFGGNESPATRDHRRERGEQHGLASVLHDKVHSATCDLITLHSWDSPTGSFWAINAEHFAKGGRGPGRLFRCRCHRRCHRPAGQSARHRLRQWQWQWQWQWQSTLAAGDLAARGSAPWRRCVHHAGECPELAPTTCDSAGPLLQSAGLTDVIIDGWPRPMWFGTDIEDAFTFLTGLKSDRFAPFPTTALGGFRSPTYVPDGPR